VAVPTWTVGQVLTASDVNSWFVPLVSYKAAATTRANNTTLSNDPDLQLSIPANTVYAITAYIDYSTASTSGIGLKFALSSWAGIGGHWGAVYKVFGDTATTTGAGPASAVDFAWGDQASNTGPWGSAATPGDGLFHTVLIEGTLIVGGTAGTLAFQWAQNTGNATAASVNTGSRLSAQRIG